MAEWQRQWIANPYCTSSNLVLVSKKVCVWRANEASLDHARAEIAVVAELVYAPDLGSGFWGFESLPPYDEQSENASGERKARTKSPLPL